MSTPAPRRKKQLIREMPCPQCNWAKPVIYAQLGHPVFADGAVTSEPAGFHCRCPLCYCEYVCTSDGIFRVGSRVKPPQQEQTREEQREERERGSRRVYPTPEDVEFDRREPE